MGISGSKTPLASTEESSSMIRLYDEESMLEIRRDVADGFVILLSGGSSVNRRRRSKRDKAGPSDDDSALTVAFLALTDGNVIDACFGQLHGGRNPESLAFKQACSAKNKIADAADTSDGVRRVAVQAYENAFRAVMEYHDELSGLNVCLRCLREATIHRDAEVSMRQAFEPLMEALMAST